MSIQTSKLDLIEWISKINDDSIIQKLKSIKEEYADSTKSLENIDKDELESIERGLKDFEEGRTHPHESARNLYGKYL